MIFSSNSKDILLVFSTTSSPKRTMQESPKALSIAKQKISKNMVPEKQNYPNLFKPEDLSSSNRKNEMEK